jgi:hypothetical protein
MLPSERFKTGENDGTFKINGGQLLGCWNLLLNEIDVGLTIF